MKNLRILHLEDDANDAELIRLHLAAEGFGENIIQVKSESEFAAALEQGGFSLILADNAGPSFRGLDALALAKQKCPGVPFIFLSGAAAPSAVNEAIQHGATDYLLKDQLALLVPRLKQ